jgi:hypothetical protein
MPHTPEQRNRHALCGAKKKNGDPCRKFAGESTDHPGVGRCKYHLGNTKDHRKHAVKVEAQKRLMTIGREIEINPIDALLWTVRVSAGHMVLIQSELEKHKNDVTSHEGQVLMRLWNDERDRLAKTAKLAVDAGVAEKHIKLVEQAGQDIARLITGILDDLRLTRTQQAIRAEVIRRHLMALDARNEPLALLPAA